MPKGIWNGPPLSNPRNRRHAALFACLNDQDAELRATLDGRPPRVPNTISIVTRHGAMLNGQTGQELVCSQTARKVRFFFWEPSGTASPSAIARSVVAIVDRLGPWLSGTSWRRAYQVDVDLAKGEIAVTPIDVAPDALWPTPRPKPA